MGSARWNPNDWISYSTGTVRKTTDEIFTSTILDPDLDPKNITVRESRDSAANPESNAIIVNLDVTGSMGKIADMMAREGMGVLVEEILKRKPISDPHIMFTANGDADYDKVPLQVSQFEADITAIHWLKKIYLEHGGGGNTEESYTLPWYFAATRTAIDCFEKRGKRGYLFTVGDEECPKVLLADHVATTMGQPPMFDLSTADVLSMVTRLYHVFHVIVEEGDYARKCLPRVLSNWREYLGQHVLQLSDYKRLAEVIVSAIEVNEGRDAAAVTKSWSGDTSIIVQKAVKDLTPATMSKRVVRL